MAAEYINAESVHQSSATTDTISITVPSDATGIGVICTGWNGNANYNLDVLHIGGSGKEFTDVVKAHYYSSPDANCVVASYILTSDDAGWPGTGANTLSYGIDGTAVNGMCIIVYYVKGIDASDPVGGTNYTNRPDISTPEDIVLSGVGANDLAFCAAHDVGAAIDIENGSVTLILESGVHNNAVVAAVYEQGQDTFRMDNEASGSMCAWFFNESTAGGGATPKGPLGHVFYGPFRGPIS